MSGPKRESQEVLRKRGSPRAIARDKEAREAKARLALPPVPKVKKPKLTRKLIEDAIKGLPGYDPYRDAGDCRFDWRVACEKIRFFHDRLTHVKGEKARQPFILEVWQIGVIANLFGWLRPDGMRRFRQLFLFVPRKNGKSPLAAGLLLAILDEGEPGAEIYGAAAEYGQASLVFSHARGMVMQNDELDEKYKIYNGQAKAITTRDGLASYRVVSAEASTKHGFNTSAYVIDEVHALPDRELVDVLDTSTGARRQPLKLYITTSDFEREGSICNELHSYACKVRDGVLSDPEFLPVIYEARHSDDWEDREVWRLANPNLGVSLNMDYLEGQYKKAISTPTFLNTFKRLHLNVRTEQEQVWIPIAEWDACGGGVDAAALAGKPCWCGLDLGSTRDTTAFVMVFPDGEGEDATYRVIPHIFIPRDNAHERERLDRVPYLTWARQGYLHLTPGNVTDYSWVRAKIVEMAGLYDVQGIAYDPWNAMETVSRLQDENGLTMVLTRQGYPTLSGPSKMFERIVYSRKLAHGGHPVLRWQLINTSVVSDVNANIRPDKSGGERNRIDTVVATIMALSLAMVRTDTKSVYRKRQAFRMI